MGRIGTGFLKKSTFKIRMVLGLSVIVLFTAFLISYFSHRTYSQLFESELAEQFAIANEQTMARIGFEVGDLFRMSNNVMFNPQVEGLIRELTEGRSELDNYVTQVELTKILMHVKYDYPQVGALYLLDLNGINRYFGHLRNNLKDIDPEVFMRLKREMEATNSESAWVISELAMSGDLADNPQYLFIRNMYNDKLEIYGLIIMVLDSSFFQTLFDNGLKGANHHAYLFDNRQKLLYSNAPEEEPDKLTLSLWDKPQAGPITGESYMYARNTAKNIGFTLVSRISLSELNHKYHTLLKRSLLVGGAGVITGVLFVILLSNRLLYPLKLLVQAMGRLRKGDFDARIDIQTKDELNFIGQGFNDMADQIQSLIREVYIGQISEREAELKAYQAQFNPHFLHNTLNGLYWKLFMENNKESARLVSSLSELLKYSLESASKRTTLREEMQQIRNYLNIQTAFMEEGLESVIQVNDDVMDCEVFRLLLQPLVENVFVHAFRNHVGPKLLVIRGYREEDMLKIEIMDNGCGMSGELIRAVMRPAQEDDVKPRLGVFIVIRRIALLYGAPYGLRYSSEPGKGTTVHISLPLKR